jgi:hypothetical protein
MTERETLLDETGIKTTARVVVIGGHLDQRGSGHVRQPTGLRMFLGWGRCRCRELNRSPDKLGKGTRAVFEALRQLLPIGAEGKAVFDLEPLINLVCDELCR